MDGDGDGSNGVAADRLRADEIRVLGCLIEKEATTPDNYPLTANALRNACNQTTSRDPVVHYDDCDVERALTSLRERGLTRTVHSRSNRAAKYRHVLPEVIGIDPAETALLAVLMLRGPQTVGELKTRTERQHRFESTDEVTSTLTALARRGEPLVLELERRPGQKDTRWVHLLGDADPAVTSAPSTSGDRMPRTDAPSGAGSPGSPGSTRSPGGSAGSTADPYGEATAEFYDLLATHEWEQFGLELLDVLDDVDPATGPIVDLGAGTGVGLAFITAAVPGATIYAIEPSKAMRTALHTRLAIDARLREAVTVDPRPFASANLPSRSCALVMSAVIGHLTESERIELWRYVIDRMPPGAPAVMQLLPPDVPDEVPPTRYNRVAVGRYVYEGWQEGSPLDERRMHWTMTYRVLDADADEADAVPIAEYTASSNWRCLGADEIRSEIEPLGLTLTMRGDVGVVHTA